jgi:hypothetical protein
LSTRQLHEPDFPASILEPKSKPVEGFCFWLVF